MSVLFADLSGSTAAAHGVDPEASTARVNEVLAAMVDAVTTSGGTVDRFLGDGLLALFGAPQAHEDDPVRAVSAAVDLCGRVRSMGAEATAGVHTGPVYLGPVGSDLHRETTAMGDVVNLAARLQGRAAAGSVVVSAATAHHVQGVYDLAPVELELKGLPAPVEAFVVGARRSRPTRLRRPEGARAPTIGRDRELRVLRDAVEALRAGSGGVALVVGDPGLGKSRLVAEAMSAAEDLRVLEGRSLQLGTSAYWAIADALRAHFGAPSDAVERECARLADAGHLPADEAPGVAAVIASLLGHAIGSDAAARWTASPPAQRQRELFAAVRSLLVALADEQPLLLVLEDLHWSDELTVGLVSSLLDDTMTSPLLVLGTYRPAREHPSWRLGTIASQRCGSRAAYLELHELSDHDAERVVVGLLDTTAIDDETRALVVDRAQGNPLYLEEVVLAAIGAGALHRDGERWRVADRDVAVSVPDTLERLVRTRVDRLPPTEQRVLRLAAAIGRVFSPTLVEALAPDDDVRAALAELDRHDLAYQERLFPEEQWTFKHVLVRETIYQSILRRDRVTLHRRIVDAIERLDPGRVRDRAAELAHHAELGDDHARAAQYLQLAAVQAAASYLNDVALDLFERALAAADRAGAADALLADLNERHADVLELLGRHDEALADYKQALARTTDVVTTARLRRKVAKTLVTMREYEAAIVELDAGTAVIGPRPNPGDPTWTEYLELQFDRARLNYWRNDPAAIATILGDIWDDAERSASARARVDMKTIKAMQLLRERRYVIDDELLGLEEECVELSADDPDLSFRSFTRFNRGFVRLWARDLVGASDDLEAARAIAEQAGDVVTQSRCWTYAAYLHRFEGDVVKCRAAAEKALTIAGDGRMLEYMGAAHANLGWVALRAGRDDDARGHIDEALELWGGIALTFAFQWAARFPLLALCVKGGDLAGAAEQVAHLREPRYQPVRADVDALLADGSEPSLRAAIELGRDLGYV